MQTLSDEEQEKCRTRAGLFEVFSETIKLQYNKIDNIIIALLQTDKETQWMDHQKVKKNKCALKKEIEGSKSNSYIPQVMRK